MDLDNDVPKAAPVPADGKLSGATYAAFISYRRKDSTPLANWVMQRLARVKPPASLLKLLTPQQRERFERRDRRYFLDREFQAANPHFWNDRLEPALRSSSFLIVVASREAFTPLRDGRPNWVVREIETFYEIHRDPRRIILLLGPGSNSAELPPSLVKISKHWDWVDLRDFKAAPWRWLSIRRLGILERELMTIVAALFAVPTHLVPVLRKAQERRRRRAWMAAATAIASVLALLTLAGAVAWKQATISQLTRALDLASTAQRLAATQEQGTAVLVALESLKTRSLPEAEVVLYRALSDLRERALLSGHSSKVLDAHFTADAGRLLSISQDDTARVWDTTTGRELHRSDLQGRPLAIAKPDGAGRAAVVLATGQVVTVDATRGVMEKAVRFAPADDKQPWQSARFSPRGDALALTGNVEVDGHKDFKLTMGRLSGEVVAEHRFATEIQQFEWAPDSSFLVVGTQDGQIYRVGAGGAPPTRLGHPDKDVRALAMSGDGRWLVMGGPVKVLALSFDGGGGPVVLPRAEITVTSAAANVNGTLLALGRWDNCIELWDMTTPRQPRLRSLLNAPCRRDAQYPLTMNELRFLPNGELLSASDDRKAVVWDTVEGYSKTVLAGHGDRLKRVVSSADGALVATITNGDLTDRHDIRLWSAHPALAPVVIEHKPNAAVERVALSADETLLATATDEGLVRVVALSTGQELMHLSLPSAPAWLTFGATGDSLFAAGAERALLLRPGAELPVWEADDATATAVSATERGRTSRTALVATRSQGVLLLDLITGTARRLATEPETGTVTVASVSGDGRWLAYGSGRSLVVVDAVSGRTEHRLSLQGDALAAFWSPGAETLLVTTAAPALEIWRATAPLAIAIHKLSGKADGISFEPRGRRAVVRAGGDVVVYDLTNGRPLAKMGSGEPYGAAHGGAIQDARLSPDGEKVVTASYDRTAAIWRADTGRMLVSLVGHGDFVHSAQFTPDGRRVVTTAVITENSVETDQQVGGSESKLIVWDAASGKPVAEPLPLGDQTVHDALLTRDGSHAVTVHWMFGKLPTRTYVLPLFADSDALVDFARRHLRRTLTPEQHRTLLRE